MLLLWIRYLLVVLLGRRPSTNTTLGGDRVDFALDVADVPNPRCGEGARGRSSSWGQIFGGQAHAARRCAGRRASSKRRCVTQFDQFRPSAAPLAASKSHLVAPSLAS